MPDKVNPIPEGFHTITPYFIVNDAQKFIEFIQSGFDAKEVHISKHDNGTIMHAEFKIGNSMIMIAQGSDKFPAMPCVMYLYVEDCDAAYKKAMEAGGQNISEPADQFYGDRTAGVKDSFGNQWWIGTHIEDVTPEEIKKRQEELYGKK